MLTGEVDPSLGLADGRHEGAVAGLGEDVRTLGVRPLVPDDGGAGLEVLSGAGQWLLDLVEDEPQSFLLSHCRDRFGAPASDQALHDPSWSLRVGGASRTHRTRRSVE